jgi:Uma2 family endonuclease
MSQVQKIQRLSATEYFTLERETDVRHEYIDGELIAMGGAPRVHNTIVFNLGAAIRPHLRGTPCRLGGGDMKVFIEAVNRGYYPDLVVSCDDPAEEADEYTETRPLLVIEVLSSTTAVTDRTEKRLNYQRLDSLQEYVLVAQHESSVEVYRRQPDGWLYIRYSAGDDIELASIDLSLPVSIVYEDIEVPPGNR